MKRLSVTIFILAVLVLVWLSLLWLQDSGNLDWGPTRSSLGMLAVGLWAGIGAGLLAALIGMLVLTLGAVGSAPEGYAEGSVRQVQCAHCKAVFHIHDTGHRPIMHVCPNCDSLGVYDGTAPPVGKPPEPEKPERIVQLELQCQRCNHEFSVTDSGRRPMDVTCPACESIGRLA